jgi:hypothetical protein
MSSRGLMKRTHSPLLSLWPVLTFACYSGSDAGGGPVDLGTTASTSPTSASTDPPTTSLPTTSATSSTSTGTLTDTTSTGPGSGSSTGAPDTSGAEPGTSSSGTTELPPSESCGDANLDPGEECDLGAAQNDDQGACTLTCKLPKCGDHLIWAGKEDCDNGDNNNDVLYGGCSTQCTYGPRCGDAKLQDSEECDLGPDNGNGEFLPDSVPCTGGCRFKAKLVFLSSVAYMAGELKTAEDADVECQKLAAKAKFDNAPSFKAWISDASHSPAKDFTKTAGLPYVRPDGVRIADDWDDLILNGPDDGITVTETGVALLSTGVWTGTGPNGQLVPETLTCKGWSSSEAGDKGQRGLSGVEKKLGPAWTQWVDNDHWTTYLISSCIFPYHLYCFEQ